MLSRKMDKKWTKSGQKMLFRQQNNPRYETKINFCISFSDSSAVVWTYRFMVRFISLCPSHIWTVLGLMPLSMHLVANVCLSTWHDNDSCFSVFIRLFMAVRLLLHTASKVGNPSSVCLLSSSNPTCVFSTHYDRIGLVLLYQYHYLVLLPSSDVSLRHIQSSCFRYSGVSIWEPHERLCFVVRLWKKAPNRESRELEDKLLLRCFC